MSREGTEPESQEVLRKRHAQAAAQAAASRQTQQHGDLLQVCNSSVGKREQTQ